ncbi:PREDICTED: carnitine O-palmitoyltransferase 1, liver isoform-like isoform X2 [Priapulus caudatus]|uniref:Carnitine O-palmitoyltransferase 1, liver isoform-like isoform X2 n=1 Tax=Priapulus caudatus TaxID=37621 RepID=A0ABM1DV05_PRICU|nr:PREDICTED: carnitine O-palmitoyltransferase 1, liver isoform-like isoform X2 [Priapulus caudatus]
MAEAHQAVAFTFQVTHDGLEVDFDHEVIASIWNSGVRSLYKNFQRHWHDLKAGIYPLEPHTLLVCILLSWGLRAGLGIDMSLGSVDHICHLIPWIHFLPVFVLYVSCTISGVLAWIGLILFTRYSLKILFIYQGWMNDPRGKFSMKTKFWAILVRFLKGKNPRLYSYQGSLPKLPLPKLRDTLKRYLISVRPLLNDEDYKNLEQLAMDFEKGIGKRFQRYLWLKSWWATNYVTDWWEDYVYLKGRLPIMVNSNFYIVDAILTKPTNIQAARAANCIHAIFEFRETIEKQEVKPLLVNGLVPLCSAQNERIFNTTRIPGVEKDHLQHWHDSSHIVVFNRGKFFKLPCYRKRDLINQAELEVMFTKILEDQSQPTDGEEHLAVLTAAERTVWAQTRIKYFRKGLNKHSLDVIEKAAFVVSLDEEEFQYDPNDSSQMDQWASHLLHGNCYNVWFDKSFTFIILKNGHVGINVEHSWADAPITAYMWEATLHKDSRVVRYKEDGHCHGTVRDNLPPVTKLKWELPDECVKTIESQLVAAQKLANDVDLKLIIWSEWGKGFIKNCKVSPDAFIQMALQLAYYRDSGEFSLTYEASMTRLYREGRTETVRPVTMESCAFVRAMEDQTTSTGERITLLRAACEVHTQRYKDAMLGKGVDRHLFCLYVVSRYLEEDSKFLEKVLSEPWKLSTSQNSERMRNNIIRAVGDLRTLFDLTNGK